MRLSCRAVSKNLRPTLGGAREWMTGKVRSGITAIAVISQLRPESINDSGGDFQSRLLADNPRPFNQLGAHVIETRQKIVGYEFFELSSFLLQRVNSTLQLAQIPAIGIANRVSRVRPALAAG